MGMRVHSELFGFDSLHWNRLSGKPHASLALDTESEQQAFFPSSILFDDLNVN